MNVFEKIGFTSRNQLFGFFSVVMSGQIIYSAFEAFKGTFYNLLLDVLQIDNTQMGILFTLIGSAMFFYIPAGWVNNRMVSCRDFSNGVLDLYYAYLHGSLSASGLRFINSTSGYFRYY